MKLKNPEKVAEFAKAYADCVVKRGFLSKQHLTIYDAIFDEIAELKKEIQLIKEQLGNKAT